jgi:cobalt-zinc-cadmium efflux system protein
VTAGALILGGDAPGEDDAEGDLSIRAVLLDTAGDAAAATGVAAMGGIILVAGGWYWLDPTVALVIAVVVGYHALALVLKVLRRLRASTAAPGQTLRH